MHTSSTVKKYVEALYDYDATDGDELSIAKGDIIAVVEELDEGWWVGELVSSNGAGGGQARRGMFPANYCKQCDPPATPTTPAPPPPAAPVQLPVPSATPTYPSMAQVAAVASIVARPTHHVWWWWIGATT
ncbi:SH3 domain-containing protein [Syncephalis pseudoplumigaleata]|uniref:SH3 domain-containing protein n=1 Tax=Syncephalis pseudoplumigaleata TaxID=1712513 RepID=A0A4P9YRD6_9FUNG|nr:SH3 domain-containing protein [Syncephalis pseudoplumigaleata]|eukprot:RKP22443.1 SH3 domain-containing protein [Syncephalis pseudoplumigaleata]